MSLVLMFISYPSGHENEKEKEINGNSNRNI